MKHSQRVIVCSLLLLAVAVAQTAGTKGVTVVSEQRLKQLLPATVFIDGENVPTQERNAAFTPAPVCTVRVSGSPEFLSALTTCPSS